MGPIGYGDLAQFLTRSRDVGRVRREMADLTQALSTGRRPDVASRPSQVSSLQAIERSLLVLGSQQVALAEAAGRYDVAAIALETSRTRVSELSGTLLSLPEISGTPQVAQAADAALAVFDGLVSDLNTRFAGQSLFAGARFDGPTLAPAEDIMNAIVAEIGGSAATTSLDVEAVVDDFFATGGAFDTFYLGSDGGVANTRIATGETVQGLPTAASDALRAILRDTAKAAVTAAAPDLLAPDEALDLVRRQGSALVSGEGGVISLLSGVGGAQAEIEASQVRSASEKVALELALGEILDADLSEVATRLSSVQAQLETMYVITARQANLSLTRYLG